MEFSHFDGVEEWRPVVIDGQPWPYEVSNIGRVRRSESGFGATKGRILKLQVKRGYLRVPLYRENKYRYLFVHRLVLAAFVGPCPEGKQTNHRNGIKNDNRVENLEWVTKSENELHKSRVLGKGRGNYHGMAKLVEEDVLQIKQRLVKREPQKDIAADYGVDPTTISCIATGKTWGWV